MSVDYIKHILDSTYIPEDGRIYSGARALVDVGEERVCVSCFRTMFGGVWVYFRVDEIGAVIAQEDRVASVFPDAVRVSHRVRGVRVYDALMDSGEEVIADVLRTLIVSSWIQDPEYGSCVSSSDV